MEWHSILIGPLTLALGVLTAACLLGGISLVDRQA